MGMALKNRMKKYYISIFKQMKTTINTTRNTRIAGVVVVLFLLFYISGLRAQSVGMRQSVQVDTLWGAHQSTPDSILFNPYSRPNIVHTYGKTGDNTSLDWGAFTPEQKKNYFTTVMGRYIRLYPNYVTVENGDTVLLVNNENSYFYSDLARYVMEGENNIEKDTASSLNQYTDIKEITVDSNGYFNLPVLYIEGTSDNGVAYAVSGIYLKDSITQHTSLENDFQLRDSRTNVSALPGTPAMAKTGTVSVSWKGYTDDAFTSRKLMTFNFDNQGDSYLTYLNPRVPILSPEKTEIQNTINDTTINYQVTWKDSLVPFTVAVNHDTTRTIHTGNGTEQVDIRLILWDTIYYQNKTPLMSGEAGNYNFTVDRINQVRFIQKSVVTDAQYPNGKTEFTTLKQSIATQHVTVKDMEPPTGDLKRTYLTVLEYAAKLDSAIAQVKNLHDNSNGTIISTVAIVYDRNPTTIFMFTLSDVTGNSKSLGSVTVDLSPDGINDTNAPDEKYGITNLWPNPVHPGQQLTLQYHSRKPGPIRFDVVTLSGQIVFSYPTTLSQKTQQINLQLPALPSGTYLLKCKEQVVKMVVH
jgi:hypothetical protein